MFYSATTLMIIVGISLPGITLLSRRYNRALEPMMAREDDKYQLSFESCQLED
jgi:hypothetical protein